MKIAGRNRIFSPWEYMENLSKVALMLVMKLANFSTGSKI